MHFKGLQQPSSEESSAMRKVLTVGVYDILHIGHILMFKHAREQGEHLTVAVQESDFIKKYKPNAKMIYSTEERTFMVSSIKFVDNVITYQSVDELIKNVAFDIFAVGPDQNHEGFKKAIEWCINNKKQVVTIPRTTGISSTALRNYLKEND